MAHRIIINGQELICFTNGEDGMFYEGENKKPTLPTVQFVIVGKVGF